MQKKKKILIIIFGILLIFLGIGLLAGNFFYNLAINPHSDKSEVFKAPHNAPEEKNDIAKEEAEKRKKRSEEEAAWYEEIEKEDISIESFDKLNLVAKKIVNKVKTDRWIILCHGYTGYGDQMLSFAKGFYDLGFNIMIPDARGHGNSQGDYIGMGWHDRLDVVKWIDLIVDENPDSQIALFGISMGGATVMMTSGEDLPENVKLIIEDCGYTSIYDEFSYQLKELFNLPAFPFMNFASLVTKVRAGYFLSDGDALRQVSKSKTPTLFIHGDEDNFVPTYMVDEVYDACKAPKEKLIIEGAGHGASNYINSDLFWTTIRDFVDKYI